MHKNILLFSIFTALLINFTLHAGPVFSTIAYHTQKTERYGHTHGYGQSCDGLECGPNRYITKAEADKQEREFQTLIKQCENEEKQECERARQQEIKDKENEALALASLINEGRRNTLFAAEMNALFGDPTQS